MRYQQASETQPDQVIDLTVEEETFAYALALGEKQIEAYAKAYGATGYNKASLEVRACRKAAEPHIQAYIRQIRAVSDAKRGLSLADAISDEEAFAQRCENAGQFGAAGAARDRRNKMLGHYTEKMEIAVNDLRSELNELAKIDPALAEAFAKEKGVTIQ